MLLPNDAGELPARVDRGAQTARAEPAQPRRSAVLPDAGAAVPAVVVGVDREAVGGEGGDEGAVATGVLADLSAQLSGIPGIEL